MSFSGVARAFNGAVPAYFAGWQPQPHAVCAQAHASGVQLQVHTSQLQVAVWPHWQPVVVVFSVFMLVVSFSIRIAPFLRFHTG
ncbi:MAG: hypothetical protein JNK87_08665 [Bryobacterales bacterium]|nr:hypothetical protein [Bryobacterales bacterium]